MKQLPLSKAFSCELSKANTADIWENSGLVLSGGSRRQITAPNTDVDRNICYIVGLSSNLDSQTNLNLILIELLVQFLIDLNLFSESAITVMKIFQIDYDALLFLFSVIISPLNVWKNSLVKLLKLVFLIFSLYLDLNTIMLF